MSSKDALKGYWIDYDINCGECTGHLMINTYDKIEITQKRFIDIGNNTTIELDGDIESVELFEDVRGWVDITEKVLK